MSKQIATFIWIFLLMGAGYAPVAAQTTANPLQNEVDEAEAKAKIAKAKKEEIEAKFPAPNTDALKGSTGVEGTLIESRIQAYKAMELISEQIAENAASKSVTGLYVFREAEYAKIIDYKKLIQRLDIINDEYDQCFGRNSAMAVPLGVAAGILLNYLSLLKTETKITGAEFDIDDEAVWASLGKSLSAKSIALGNPFISILDNAELTGISASDLIIKLNKAEADFPRPCTNAYAFKPQIDAAFLQLKKDIKLVTAPPTPETKKTITTTTIAPPTTVIEEVVTTTPASLSSPDAPSFIDYLKIEEIIKNMDANKIYWIKIKNVKAGGNMRMKSNPLIDIFRGGSSVKFSGGSVAYYYILDNLGNVVLSGSVYGYIPYKKSSKL